MKRILPLTLALTSIFLLPAASVLAAALYLITMTVTESAGTSYTNLPIIVSVNNAQLVAGGYLGDAGMDAKVDDGTYYLPRMITNDKTLFVGDLPANVSKVFNYTLHDNVWTASMPIITGVGGNVTTPDNPSLEPGNECEIILNKFVNTTATGADRVIMSKYDDITGGVQLIASGSVSGNITCKITDIAHSTSLTLTALGVTSVIHEYKITLDGTTAFLYIDGVLEESEALP
jgi:hypothetical protein